MKGFAFCLLILLCPLRYVKGQESDPAQDPAAREILDRSAARIKGLKSIEADFELIIEDRKEETKNNSKGNIQIKQDKYKLVSGESTVYFDGYTMWTYSSDVDEVVITQPDKSDDDFLSNPAKIFTWYNRDFKYLYVGKVSLGGHSYDEVDLFPRNLDQPYSRIKVFINPGTNLPEVISSVGKDGIDYTVNLLNIKTNQELDDHVFVFDPASHKRTDVIDMRGIK